MNFLFFLITFTVCIQGFGQGASHNHGAQQPVQPNPSLEAKQLPISQPQKSKTEDARVAVEVPAEQQSRMGLKVVQISKKKVDHTIRAVGTVTADQTKEAHVHTRVNGWVEDVYADFIGKAVKKNQPLFSLYSPEIVSTQEEFIAARKQGGIGKEISQAALERLRLWNVSEKEIENIKKSNRAKRALIFDSPGDGVVVNKGAIKGMYVTPEMELYYIANLEKVWVIVSLYESDLAVVSVGDEATIQLPHDPSKILKGKINYIYPDVQIETRTAKARVELLNPDQSLKPGMFAQIEVKKNLGELLTVPDDSVIDTGIRKIVFVKSSASRFEPREIKIGPRVGESFTVISGLKEGEAVVSGAQFLIDTESKLQAALQKGDKATPGHGSHGK